MMRGKKGESGIGTLILFIAMILVAAIAAGVLIQTSMNLQSKALSTGSKAKSQVSTSLSVSSIYADNSSADTIDDFHVTVKLSAGSDPIKISDTLVELILTNASYQYTAGSVLTTAPAQSTGNYNYYYEINGTGHRDGYIVSGDIVTLHLQSGRDVNEDEDFRITISPKTGSITQIYSSTPEVITTTKVVLYP